MSVFPNFSRLMPSLGLQLAQYFQLILAGKKIQKVVKLCKNYDLPKQPSTDARFKRRTPSRTRFENQKPALRYKRARFYHAQLGRFISRDPLGYVDGMSLYRAYFVPNHLDPWGKMVRVDETFPKNGWDLPGNLELDPKLHTVVRLCRRPINSTKGIYGHLYIAIQLRKGWHEVVTAGPGTTDKYGCGFKQLLVQHFPYSNNPDRFPKDANDPDAYPDYPGNGPEQSTPDKHHCTLLVLNKPREEVYSCMLEIAKRINECCIPYDASAVGKAKNGCNSNCAAYWITKSCLRGALTADPRGLDGDFIPRKPKGLKPGTPGWGKEIPDCISNKPPTPRPEIVDIVNNNCKVADDANK